MTPRLLFNGFLTVALLAALILIGRVLITPDAGGSLFSKARQLEAGGQIALALRHYALVADRHPESSLAPRALLKQGELLSARGRINKDTESLRAAMNAYARLAENYPDNKLANAALFDAGQIAAEDLDDGVSARRFYKLIMERNSDRSDETAMATTKLGRLALAEGDQKTALELLQSVNVNWPTNAEAGAEAQFHMGVLYETLFKDRAKAQRAYDKTLTAYPNSVWAGDARTRLGLLAYNDQIGRRPVRRVMLDIAPLPSLEGLNNPTATATATTAQGSDLWSAFGILLGARGLTVDDTITRGWSLLPFYAGIDRTKPGRIVRPTKPFDPFDNVAANAGLRYTPTGGGTAEDALRQLQNDLDSARQPLLYIENGGEGRWTLCVGYDSDRGEVYLQDRGARFDTVAVESFAQMWKAKSKFEKSFTMLSFLGQSEKPRVLQELSAQAQPTSAPGEPVVAPTPRLNATPQFIWELPRLKQSDANVRTLRRGAILMNRQGNETVALNVAGLNYLARELVRIADSPDPNAFGGFSEPPIRQQDTFTDANGVEVAPTATPAPRDFAPRARSVMAFFGDPARSWASNRRRAAAFCEVAGRQNNRNLSDAISNFNLSADSLDAASAIAPLVGDILTEQDRANMREMARQISIARDAEAAAARAMGD